MLFPPGCTSHFGGHAIHQQFIQCREEDAHRGERGRWLKIVIDRRDEGAALARTREGANFDGGFGIHGEAQDVVRGIRGLIDRGHLGEDGVSCRDFFCG